MSIQMCICPKCAWFKGRRKCDFCNIQMIVTDTTIDEVMEMSDKQEKELINHYIETLIKDTYDPNARKYREASEANEPSLWADYVSESLAKCPTCQSTSLKKITVTSKAMNTALFGLFGTKRHKTFHCNNCGYEW